MYLKNFTDMIKLKQFLDNDLHEKFLKHPKNFHKYVKLRIFEGNLRIRDYNIHNYQTVILEEGSIEFQIVHNGIEDNWVHFKDHCVVYYDFKHEMLLIHVNGNVYYKNGERRYSEFTPFKHPLKYNAIRYTIDFRDTVSHHEPVMYTHKKKYLKVVNITEK